jgi:putative ABC transport system ATP-binding protein
MSVDSNAALVAEHLSKKVTSPEGTLTILDDVGFAIGRAESVAIVGPSGAGKSTLLALLAGLDTPSSGRVWLEGRELSALDEDGRAAVRAARVGFVFQSFHLVPSLTAIENVMLPMELDGAEDARERAAAILAEVGLAARKGHYPNQLSGGEKQRVAIARAFACRPRLLLMDEPFSSLDAMAREKLQDALTARWRDERLPWVVVTHSLEEAALLGRRILVLAGRPARVAAAFENPLFGDPDQRNQEEHFELVRRLRRSLEEAS